MTEPDKKIIKQQAKSLKKQAKADQKLKKREQKAAARAGSAQPKTPPKTSTAVKFAETVRGILYLILSVSLVIAVILSNKGYIITLEDVIDSLILARLGKVVLILIAAAFFIYGLKRLRVLK